MDNTSQQLQSVGTLKVGDKIKLSIGNRVHFAGSGGTYGHIINEERMNYSKTYTLPFTVKRVNAKSVTLEPSPEAKHVAFYPRISKTEKVIKLEE